MLALVGKIAETVQGGNKNPSLPKKAISLLFFPKCKPTDSVPGDGCANAGFFNLIIAQIDFDNHQGSKTVVLCRDGRELLGPRGGEDRALAQPLVHTLLLPSLLSLSVKSSRLTAALQKHTG